MENQKIILNELAEADDEIKFSSWYFKDAFDVSTHPNLLIKRKEFLEQLDELIDMGSLHHAIYALPGLGKTVTTKYFFNNLQRKESNVKVIYVNCKEHRTKKEVYFAVRKKMEEIWPPMKKYRMNNRTAMVDFIKQSPDEAQYYLILDEVDIPISNERRKEGRGAWLSFYFRLGHGKWEGKDMLTPKPTPWRVFLVTNKKGFLKKLHKDELQHLYRTGLKPYNAHDITRVMKKRLKIGIENKDISSNLFSEKAVALLGKWTTNIFESNVRTGFQLLTNVGKRASRQNRAVTEKDIEEEARKLEIKIILDNLAELSRHERGYFFSVILFLINKKRKGKELTFYAKETFPIFKRYCEQNGLGQLQAIPRAVQRYLSNGKIEGCYVPTGEHIDKYPIYELGYEYDLGEIYKMMQEVYFTLDFNIDLSNKW